jgi:outer membrane lipoprotein LolB
MSRRLCVQWGLCASLLYLAGCASLPPPSQGPNHWTGRLALHIQDSPVQRHSAGFELIGSATQGELNLFNPLGSTVAQARWTPTLALLQQGERIQTFTDMPELMQAATGAALPLSAVFDWLQGLPASSPGWDVDLSQHAQGRIRAQRSTPLPVVQLLIVLQSP